MNKKLSNRAFGFAILGLILGVFYREFTKFYNFEGKTVLGVIHSHLFVLGTFFLLGLIVFNKLFNLELAKKFNNKVDAYTVGLCGVVLSMLVRGIFQVQGVELSKALNASISGVSGIFHGIFGISFILILNDIRKAVAKND